MTSRPRHNHPVSGRSAIQSNSRTKSKNRSPRRRSLIQQLESRQLLAGPQLIGVQPNEGEIIIEGDVRNLAPQVLTFRFDENQVIDPATLSGIQIVRSGIDDVFGTADDVRVVPGSVVVGDPDTNQVDVRFAGNLPDDNYRVTLFGFDDPAAGITAVRNADGEVLQTDNVSRTRVLNFELNLGALVQAVVPQPVVRQPDGTLRQNRDEIVVYFNEDPLFVENDAAGNPTARSAENPRFYQLFLTQETVSPNDDAFFNPTRVVYDPATFTARLFFGQDINTLAATGGEGGTWRLRLGTTAGAINELTIEPQQVDLRGLANDPGEIVSMATEAGDPNLVQPTPRPDGTIARPVTSRLIQQEIDNLNDVDLYRFVIDLPGTGQVGRFSAETFAERLAELSDLDTSLTLFAETTASVTTDLRTGTGLALELTSTREGVTGNGTRVRFIQNVNPSVTTVQIAAETGVNGEPLADAFVVVLPIGQVTAAQVAAAINADPISNSLVTAEVVAGNDQQNVAVRQAETFTVTLAGGALEAIARNDDYFAEDSFLEANLGSGTYFLGVASSGNDQFLPNIPGTASGGVTTGRYDVLLKFEPQVDQQFVLRDRDSGLPGVPGTPIDGDNDGRPGGANNFWFQTRSLERQLRFDLPGDAVPAGTTIRLAGPGGLVRTYQLFRTGDQPVLGAVRVTVDGLSPAAIASAFVDQVNLQNGLSATGVTAAQQGITPTVTILGEQSIDASVSRAVTVFGRQLFVDRLGPAAATGSLTLPFNNIANPAVANAFGAASAGDIVRIVGNGGTDNNLTTTADNFAYQVGVSETGGRVLRDGRDLLIPAGVTTMIDAGAAIKFRDARLEAGSSNLNVDRSGSQLQILGTPRLVNLSPTGAPVTTTLVGNFDDLPGAAFDDGSVILTSTRDRRVEAAAAAGSPPVGPGDWGGVVLRQDFDTSQGRFSLEREGIFLDTINGADIRYGGAGDIQVDSTQQLINPITMLQRRPTIAFNEITFSADAAISASPDTFEETTFQSPRFQAGDDFTADYDRVGPEITGNLLIANSINAMLIRINTGPTTPPEQLRVAGRFDDTDVVHYLAENLIIVGSQPPPVDIVAPDLTGVSVTAVPGGDLPAGTYRYVLTFVDEFGFESDAGGQSAPVTVDGTQAIDLQNLPIVGQQDNFVARRLYRLVPGAGFFELIADLPASTLRFIDDGRVPVGTGRPLPASGPDLNQTTLTAFDDNVLPAGDFEYRVTFADSTLVTPESDAQAASPPVTVDGTQSVDLAGIPTLDPTGPFNQRLVYRSVPDSSPQVFELIGSLPPDVTTFSDTGDQPVGAVTPREIVNDPAAATITTAVIADPVLAAGSYRYVMTFANPGGAESAAGGRTDELAVDGTQGIRLDNLPVLPAGSVFSERRLYRSIPGTSQFGLIGTVPAGQTTFIDSGQASGAARFFPIFGRSRLDASLVIDPGLVLKINGARIELQPSTQLLAEGTATQSVVLTSLLDDRFGAGGTFDTDNGNLTIGGPVADRGDWAGIFADTGSRVSIDNAVVAYAGGISLLPGGESLGFVPLTLNAAAGRVTNSRFEFNDDGQDGAARDEFPIDDPRNTGPSVIYAVDTQPIIVGNTFVDNRGSAIDIDVQSLTGERIVDPGRNTGPIDRFVELDDNFGPLVRQNRFQIVANDDPNERQLSGMEVRGGVITTETIFDDTDIDHLVFDSIVSPNASTAEIASGGGGALRLLSRAEQSLVVKFRGFGNPHSATFGTGISATGMADGDPARLGGTVQVIGLPGAPVVLTSLRDDTVGSALQPDGRSLTDSNGDGFSSRPEPNDWRSVLIDQNSNQSNVEFVLERELADEPGAGVAGLTGSAQFVGRLAADPAGGDSQLRAGFEIEGFLEDGGDIDVYSFDGPAGTEVFLDIDNTTFNLDTVLEILDATGNLLARSNDSAAELAGTPLTLGNGLAVGSAGSLRRSNLFSGAVDADDTNPKNAGLRISLPGNTGTENTYFVRVRSNPVNIDDADGGLTRGAYRLQIRLSEDQAFSGSSVRQADIRYANHGVHARGVMATSPLLSDVGENESGTFTSGALARIGPFATNVAPLNSNDTPFYIAPDIFTAPADAPGVGAQYLGNLNQTPDGSLSLAGDISNFGDVDFYRIDGLSTFGGRALTFDIDYASQNGVDTSLAVYFDPDGVDGAAPLELIYVGTDSNVLDDQLLGTTGRRQLSAGSDGPADPFIGPVSLPADGTFGFGGTYYVAVGSGVPVGLTETGVRLVPIASVERLFDDTVGGVATGIGSTAEGPRQTPFIDTTSPAFTASGFGLDASPVITVSPLQQIGEGEPNNTNLQALDIDPAFTFPDANDNIGDRNGRDTTRLFPSVSINGTLQNNNDIDRFRFTVENDNDTIILDIDNGFDSSVIQDEDSAIPANNVDLALFLFRLVPDPNAPGGFTQQLVASNNDFAATAGRGGSTAGEFSTDTSTVSLDPFLQLPQPGSNDPLLTNLPAGEYVVAVVAGNRVFVNVDANGVVVNNFTTLTTIDPSFAGTYELNVSVQGKTLVGGGGGQAIRYNRQVVGGTATVASEVFDLTGYSAADQPTLYFDYLYDPAVGDSVTVTAQVPRIDPVTGQQAVDINDVPLFDTVATLAGSGPLAGGANVIRTDPITPRSFQARVPLDAIVGLEQVRIAFTYNRPDATPSLLDRGLFLDNFIVGFAERGEQVIGAAEGNFGFVGGTGGTGGYQLDIRPSTPGVIPVGGGNFVFGETFDTNERLSRSVTIVAPLPSEIQTDDTFTLSDNRRQLTFQFTRGGAPAAGNVGVDIAAAQTRDDVAAALIATLRGPAVQSQLSFIATTVTGTATVPGGDGLVALNGTVDGDLFAVPEDSVTPTLINPGAQPAPPQRPDASASRILLPALISDRIGDVNVQRAQSQLIIAQSIVSDVNAVGIFQEAGDRGLDPTRLSNPFLRAAPIGASTPGPIRNFPGAVSPVTGGLSQGILVENNIVDQAGYAGIRIEGENPPMVIDSPFFGGTLLEDLSRGLGEPNRPGDPVGDVDFDFGDYLADGLLLEIDASGITVVFEFEDVAGGAVATEGSGTVGGDGFGDGHVPIFIRHTSALTRADTRQEVMTAIYQAILGSILVTNDLVQIVEPRLALSKRYGSELEEGFANGLNQNPSAAVYVLGASAIRFGTQPNTIARTVGAAGNPFVAYFADVADSPQPVAQIVNNTVYGADGTESQAFELAVVDGRDGDDLFSGAVDTKVGRAHTGPYVTPGLIGNGPSLLSPGADVDLYEIELVVGDRLIADIDTVAGGVVAPGLQLLNEAGQVVGAGLPGQVPPALEANRTRLAVGNDVGRASDPFLDFVATATGTYYVAVSAATNLDFSIRSLSGRPTDADGTGAYTLSLEAFTPRKAVVSIDDNDGGTVAADLNGHSVVLTQVSDVPGFQGNNRVQIIFGDADPADVGAAVQVRIPLDTAARDRQIPELIRALARTIQFSPFLLNQFAELADPDTTFNDGTPGVLGPVRPVFARALGGQMGGIFAPNELFPNADLIEGIFGLFNVIETVTTNNAFGTVSRTTLLDSSPDGLDLIIPPGFNRNGFTSLGFGLDRPDLNNALVNVIPTGYTELYAAIENVAGVEVYAPNGSTDTPLKVDPAPGVNMDQVLPETGIQFVAGVSGSIINNVLLNLTESVVVEEVQSGGTIDNQFDGSGFNGDDDFLAFPRVVDAVVTSNLFQYDDPNLSVLLQNIDANNVSTAGNAGYESLTDSEAGPSNINGGNDDRNIDLDRLGLPPGSAPTVPLLPSQLINADGNNFLPLLSSLIVDSGTSALVERPTLSAIRNSVGIAGSNLVTPRVDINGTRRVDNPNVSPPSGIGTELFVDRGAVERADFNGPFAVTITPLDNDTVGLDADPTVGRIVSTEPNLREIRIQLRDTGDLSDPFSGVGIDDNTVVLPVIPGVRPAGANVLLFENGRVLTEGIDYTFAYDATGNAITLTPLAGVFRNDRAYRVELNNRDRDVLVLPQGDQIVDGAQVEIVDTAGGAVVFEFERGFELILPTPPTIVVPDSGSGADGLADGDVFQISVAGGTAVTFEFDADNVTLGDSVVVDLTADDPANPGSAGRIRTAEEIAVATLAAINATFAPGSTANPGTTPVVFATRDGLRIRLAAIGGLTLDTQGGGLQIDGRGTLLRTGVLPGNVTGLVDGQTFTVTTGTQSVLFEIDSNGLTGGRPSQTRVNVTIPAGSSPAAAASLLAAAITNSPLRATATAVGTDISVRLPAGSVVTADNAAIDVLAVAPAGTIQPIVVSPGTGANPILAPGTVLTVNSPTGTTTLRVTAQAPPAGTATPPGQFIVGASDSAAVVAERLAAAFADTSLPLAARVNPAMTDTVEVQLPAGFTITSNSPALTVASTQPSPGVGTVINLSGVGDVDNLPLRLIPVAPVADGGQPPRDNDDLTVEFVAGEDPAITAGRVQDALDSISGRVTGLGPDSSSTGEIVAVNGNGNLTISISPTSNVALTGNPQTSGSSTISVAGPLQLTIPNGVQIANGSVLTLLTPTGDPVRFRFVQSAGGLNPIPGQIVIPFSNASTGAELAAALSTAINAVPALGIASTTTTVAGRQIVSLGRLANTRVVQDPVPIDGLPAASPTTFFVDRGIIADGERVTIRQGTVTRTFEFESNLGGGGVAMDNIAVRFSSGSSPVDIARFLQAAIENNSVGLDLDPVLVLGPDGLPTGEVDLNDAPGTQVDISGAPTLQLTGVPGGAIPVQIFAGDTASTVGSRLLMALQGGANINTPIRLTQRTENTIFIENASIVRGPLTSFSLPGIADRVGNLLEPNTDSVETEFVITLPGIQLDFGDASQQVGIGPGRYPTTLEFDGPRHIIGGGPLLGQFIDAEIDGQPSELANGDDRDAIFSLPPGSTLGGLFNVAGNSLTFSPTDAEAILGTDGQTITLQTSTATVTLELTTDAIFDENNFAIFIPPLRPGIAATLDQRQREFAGDLARAIRTAIQTSPAAPAAVLGVPADTPAVNQPITVRAIGDDEDGVLFTSLSNPNGVFNRSLSTPISVTVSGSGVLQGWLDFNADGDFDDPGETIIVGQSFSGVDGQTQTLTIPLNVPATSTLPVGNTFSTARFRVSAQGGLQPTGLALSGEVEDYRVRLAVGTPPTLPDTNPTTPGIQTVRNYSTPEDVALTVPPSSGLLVGVVDADPGDVVTVAPGDVGDFILFRIPVGTPVDGSLGEVVTLPGTTATGGNAQRFVRIRQGAGVNVTGLERLGLVTINGDGSFSFTPSANTFGQVAFNVRATDDSGVVIAGQPFPDLVSATPITGVINVVEVNDPPSALPQFPASAFLRTLQINEDEVQLLQASTELDPFFTVGAGEQASQQLVFATGTGASSFTTPQGGTITIVGGGRTLRYTPPTDASGQSADTFTIRVGDASTIGNTSLLAVFADQTITYRVNIAAVNDPPIAGRDNFAVAFTQPGQTPTLVIPINGTVGDPGILDNDFPGPPNERATQTLQPLDPAQFTRATAGGVVPGKLTNNGGTVTFNASNQTLTYTPRPNSGDVDSFTYVVTDSLGASTTGTVVINVTGVNDPPLFLGIDGQAPNNNPVRTRVEAERKLPGQTTTINLGNAFIDPDGDPLTYTASIVQPNSGGIESIELVGSQLIATFRAFGFGATNITVTASDDAGLSTTETLTIDVMGTPDAPRVTQPIGTVTTGRNTSVSRNLNNFFDDPDGDLLTFTVTRVGTVANPTQAQLLAGGLIQTINLVQPTPANPLGGRITINPQPGAIGSVEIEVTAAGGTGTAAGEISQVFTLVVEDQPGAPTARDDGQYTVRAGGTLDVSTRANGVLGNDSDPDNASGTLLVAAADRGERAGRFGTINLNADGTFVYTNTSAPTDGTDLVGQFDEFTYRAVDPQLFTSNVATIRIGFSQSQFRNPTNGPDVNNDGAVSALDALRIINLLNRFDSNLISTQQLVDAGIVPAGDGPGLANFYDVNGDGFASSRDALRVIESLQTNPGNRVGGEPLAAAAASTTAYATAGTLNLPSANVSLIAPAVGVPPTEAESLDALFAGGVEIGPAKFVADDWTDGPRAGEREPNGVDDSLSGWSDRSGDVDVAIGTLIDELALGSNLQD